MQDTGTGAAARHALAEAESLVTQGRRLDAIDVLMDANRRERDAAIEVRLVTLRNEAYEELDRSPRDAPWPDAPTPSVDPVDALAPIDPGDLTAARVREDIMRYGCAFVPKLVPQDRADMLVESIDRAFAAAEARDEGAHRNETSPWFVPYDQNEAFGARRWVRVGGGVWTVEAPRGMFDFLDTLEAVGLRPVFEEYLGERPAMTLKKSTLRRTPVLPGADWHQDGAFLGDDIRTLNIWLSLSHCGDDAPGLDLVPRRFDEILETGKGGANFDWSVGPETVAEAAGDVEVVRPRFEPGDVLLFDEKFLHRTATDETMTRERYAVENWFFAPSLYPDDQIPFVW